VSPRPRQTEPLQKLRDHYQEVVDEKFDGIIPRDFRIVFNPFLRRLTGRITYSQRLIEISRFHFERYGLEDAIATLEHELLHLYLHKLGLPSGHNNEFKKYARQKGIRVYHENPYPKNRPSPFRYLYECPSCNRLVFRKRPIAHELACGVCCRTHANGAFHSRYALRLVQRVRMV
jgi:predicted SprT family Zn-dependent metalloprotease